MDPIAACGQLDRGWLSGHASTPILESNPPEGTLVCPCLKRPLRTSSVVPGLIPHTEYCFYVIGEFTVFLEGSEVTSNTCDMISGPKSGSPASLGQARRNKALADSPTETTEGGK
jgi:hypothetical protein